MDIRGDNRHLEGCADFAALLQQLMARVQRRDADLARLTGIPARTIEKWRRGEVRHPRHLTDLLKLAQALALDAAEATQLLQAAGHPPLAALRQEAQQAPDPALTTLLEAWPPTPPSAPVAAGPGSQAWPAPQRHQLRPPIADFAGRDQETAQLVTDLLMAVKQGQGAIISGVQGMGGVGKTELAYRVAHQLRMAFPDAQLVLDLRGSSSAPLSPAQTLQAAIRAFIPGEPLVDDLHELQQHYRAVLHGQRVLILADDARDAAQVRLLLPPAGSALLITSRMRFTLPGMASIELEQLSEEESVMLLRSICGRLGVAEAQVIARACGCLPLALRVSGGMLHNDPALDVTAYIQQLTNERQRLAQLRDPDDPQLDVEASLLSSYAQLDAASQQVFRQLGVFIADFATAMALAIVEPLAGVDVAATLRLLLRRSLVLYDGERARWRLHDLVRDLARHQLEAQGQAEATAWRYAHAAVQLARESEQQYLAGGDSMVAGLAQFDAEWPHIDAARRWATDHAGTPAGDRMLVEGALAANNIGTLRCDLRWERIQQLESALAAAQRVGDRSGEGYILNTLGNIYMSVGEIQQALVYYEQRLTIACELGDRHGEGKTRSNLGLAYLMLGAPRQALAYFEHARTIAQELGNRRSEGNVLDNLGLAYLTLGLPKQAIKCLERARTIAQELGDQRLEGHTLSRLGVAYTILGANRQALPYLEQAITILRMLGDRYGESMGLGHLGNVYTALGMAGQALPYFEQALTIMQASGNRCDESAIRSDMGLAYLALGDIRQAITCGMLALEFARVNDERYLEGLVLSALGRIHAVGSVPARTTEAFERALALLSTVDDRRAKAKCSWHYGLFLVQQEEHERALPLLRAAVAYEKEIEHVQAAEHAALLAQIASAAELPLERPLADEQSVLESAPDDVEG